MNPLQFFQKYLSKEPFETLNPHLEFGNAIGEPEMSLSKAIYICERVRLELDERTLSEMTEKDFLVQARFVKENLDKLNKSFPRLVTTRVSLNLDRYKNDKNLQDTLTIEQERFIPNFIKLFIKLNPSAEFLDTKMVFDFLNRYISDNPNVDFIKEPEKALEAFPVFYNEVMAQTPYGNIFLSKFHDSIQPPHMGSFIDRFPSIEGLRQDEFKSAFSKVKKSFHADSITGRLFIMEDRTRKYIFEETLEERLKTECENIMRERKRVEASTSTQTASSSSSTTGVILAGSLPTTSRPRIQRRSSSKSSNSTSWEDKEKKRDDDETPKKR